MFIYQMFEFKRGLMDKNRDEKNLLEECTGVREKNFNAKWLTNEVTGLS